MNDPITQEIADWLVWERDAATNEAAWLRSVLETVSAYLESGQTWLAREVIANALATAFVDPPADVGERAGRRGH